VKAKEKGCGEFQISIPRSGIAQGSGGQREKRKSLIKCLKE
jgi:hypothetical protein|tara:strand:- start:247 stop:369 length:123 start_codon:yes stop_codon:yes gene_type:complete